MSDGAADGQRRRKRGGSEECVCEGEGRKEPFNSSGHLKDRSGFLVAVFGFCGSAPELRRFQLKIRRKERSGGGSEQAKRNATLCLFCLRLGLTWERK